jgi:hypothetical protein
MSSSNNSRSVPHHNTEYYARSPEVRYKNTRKRKSTPVKYSTYARYYNYTNPARNSNEYQNRFRVTPPSSPFRFGVGSPSPPPRQSPRISERQRKENEKLKVAQKRNENRRKREAAEKKAKEEAAKKVAAKKPTTLLENYSKKLKNAKNRKELRKVFKEGALLFHPNKKGGTTSKFQKWQNLFNKLQKQF